MIEDEVLERIQYFLNFNHWTIYKLAKVSELSYSSLNNLFNRKTCPTIATLEKICKGLDISLSEFFNFNSNPLRNNNITPEEQDLLNSYAILSIKDKELLQAYLQGLKKE